MTNDKAWDRFDKEHPEIRIEAQAEAATARQPETRWHSGDEIWDYISHDYPDLRKAKGVSIGMLGGIYRVAVEDQFHVVHTIKIDPKTIEAHQAVKRRAKALLYHSTARAQLPGKDKEHDHER